LAVTLAMGTIGHRGQTPLMVGREEMAYLEGIVGRFLLAPRPPRRIGLFDKTDAEKMKANTSAAYAVKRREPGAGLSKAILQMPG